MNQTSCLRLLDRDPQEVFAQLPSREVLVGEFLADAIGLAEQLPDQPNLVNLVRNRYQFTVGFAAALIRGQTNVLPPNATQTMLEHLERALGGIAVLHDGLEIPGHIRSLAMPEPDKSCETHVPMIPENHVAMRAFTSGSSGESKPVPKTLGMLKGAAGTFESWLIPRGTSVVATVPAQHMYGLELATLQALWSPIRFSSGKPLFPAEVARELALVPSPRVLVTTPLHLRALLESGIEFPKIERILCATAPLQAALARQAEGLLDAELLDVYGCSEAGSLAYRRLAKTTEWTLLPGLTTHQTPDGQCWVNGGHFDEPVPLADRLEPSANGGFNLTGRVGDLINVAGKRGSLAEITNHILQTPGVEDAAVFMPDGTGDILRPAGVYSGTASRAEIRAHLKRVLDPVFLPRPLLKLDQLPRTATSKLPRQALLDCLAQYRKS